MEEKKLRGNHRYILVKIKFQLEGQAAYNATEAERGEGIWMPERQE